MIRGAPAYALALWRPWPGRARGGWSGAGGSVGGSAGAAPAGPDVSGATPARASTSRVFSVSAPNRSARSRAIDVVLRVTRAVTYSSVSNEGFELAVLRVGKVGPHARQQRGDVVRCDVNVLDGGRGLMRHG